MCGCSPPGRSGCRRRGGAAADRTPLGGGGGGRVARARPDAPDHRSELADAGDDAPGGRGGLCETAGHRRRADHRRQRLRADGSFETRPARRGARLDRGGRVRVLQSGRKRRLRRRQQRRHPRRAGARRGAALRLSAEPGPGAIRALLDHLEPLQFVAATSTGRTARRTCTAFVFIALERVRGRAHRAYHPAPRPPRAPLPIPETATAGGRQPSPGARSTRLASSTSASSSTSRRPTSAGGGRLADRLRSRERGHPHRLGVDRDEDLGVHSQGIDFAPLRQEPRGWPTVPVRRSPILRRRASTSVEPGERVACVSCIVDTAVASVFRAAACRMPLSPEPRPPRPGRVACGSGGADQCPNRDLTHALRMTSAGVPRAARRGAARAEARRSPRW